MGNYLFYSLAAQLYYVIKVLEFRKALGDIILIQ